MAYMQIIGPVVYSNDCYQVIQFMQMKNLLAKQRYCKCGSHMQMKTRASVIDQWTWRCPDTLCHTMSTIRAGSFFEKSKISLDKWLLLLHHWATNAKVATTSSAVGVSKVTIMQVNKFFREICSTKLLQTPIVLGRPGCIVEIDESQFSHKVKAHRGHPPRKEVWVFGIVDTTHEPALGYMEIVQRRDAATLLPIIQAHVCGSAVVHSDEWRAYYRIQSQLGLQHHTVNHSIEFKSPTGVHTNHIESYWNRAKMKIKSMRGCTENELPSYLDEFMYKERYGRTPDLAFWNVIAHIAEFYPV